jgi:hypothetical protein
MTEEVVIDSVDQHYRICFRSFTGQGRSRLAVFVMHATEGGAYQTDLATPDAGFPMDNVVWTHSLHRGDKLSVSDRDYLYSLLLDLRADEQVGSIFFSIPKGAGSGSLVAFKVGVDGRQILALRRWLLAREDVSMAGYLPALHLAEERLAAQNRAA